MNKAIIYDLKFRVNCPGCDKSNTVTETIPEEGLSIKCDDCQKEIVITISNYESGKTQECVNCADLPVYPDWMISEREDHERFEANE